MPNFHRPRGDRGKRTRIDIGRILMRLGLLLACTFTAIPCLAFASNDQPPKSKRGPVVLTDAAKKIHAEALVFDGHNDLPWKMRDKNDPFAKQLDIAKPQPQLHTDIPRLRQG